MNEISKKIQGEIISLLGKFSCFINNLQPLTSHSQIAYYMLLTRSCNAFISAYTLCSNGLHVDSYNSVRMGLENGWLSLILNEHDDRALEWLTLVPLDSSPETVEKRYRKTYGSLTWIREEVSVDNIDKKQRDNIYQILCTKSHANVASAFFIAGSTPDENNFCLYKPGTMNDPGHKHKNLKGILYCLKYILYDIQSRSNEAFGVEWTYDQASLFNIAGGGYPDGKGGIEVISGKVNAMYQAIVLLELAKRQKKAQTNA
jgi:hypothetical protein